ncbi:hypothetical protein A3E95_02195 [Candidatus Nomurabacteria bacterium RIFCSPHIGHO2_12_FULL_44_22b]|nr:MAG: hypothetical protein A3E95_02195 [Candidatus Nomurabacteria bacterium RIFCSPHIGHO2_12_FULL_44_22b]
MDKEILEAIRDATQDSTRLLAILVKRNGNQGQIIKEMYNVGFSPKRIAELLQTSSNTVNVAIHLSKKKDKK